MNYSCLNRLLSWCWFSSSTISSTFLPWLSSGKKSFSFLFISFHLFMHACMYLLSYVLVQYGFMDFLFYSICYNPLLCLYILMFHLSQILPWHHSLQAGFSIPLICLHHFKTSPYFMAQAGPDSPCTFPVSALGSAISPRNTISC